MIKKKIYCTIDLDGVHNWADIPDDILLEDVQFLKDIHRHIFKIKCIKGVEHNNRDIEFIHMKRDVKDYLSEKYYDEDKRTHLFGSKSCEMIAEELLRRFHLDYCEVSEDGENGSIVEYIND